MYIPSCKRPISNQGRITAPPALFFVNVDELDEPLEELVPVGAVVTIPVPAVPAWLRRLEHEELFDPNWILAFPLKSQAVEAFLWFW
jgi:hypothetical protein